MSVCSARRRESKAKTSSSKRRSVVDPAELQALRTAAEELLQTEIRFIYAVEFEELEGESEPVTAALLLLEELQVSAAEVSKTVSESSADPGSGLNACDPLLTFSQEQTLFRAMNLLRYRANRMRSRLDPSAPRRS